MCSGSLLRGGLSIGSRESRWLRARVHFASDFGPYCAPTRVRWIGARRDLEFRRTAMSSTTAALGVPIAGPWPHWSLARQFLIAHFGIVLLGVLVTGAWIGNQIESSVLERTGSVTALYVDSVISPRLQNLAVAQWLSTDE